MGHGRINVTSQCCFGCQTIACLFCVVLPRISPPQSHGVILGVFVLNVTSPSVVLVHTSACLFCVLPLIVRHGGHGVIFGVIVIRVGVDQKSSPFDLRLLESLYIKQRNPDLNNHDTSFPLSFNYNTSTPN